MVQRLKKYLLLSLTLNIVALVAIAGIVVHLTVRKGAPAQPTAPAADQFTAYVDANDGGKTLFVTLDKDSPHPFSQAVVTISENTSLYTLDGTRIAIDPEKIAGKVLVKYSAVEKLEGDTSYLTADEIFCSGR